MPAFFIDRPVFAWVVALLISLGGLLAIPFLAVAQYPIIAPPSISITQAIQVLRRENLYNSVTRLIEQELNGANGILNFESTSDSLGHVEITANFVPGTGFHDRLGRGAEPHQARRRRVCPRRSRSRACGSTSRALVTSRFSRSRSTDGPRSTPIALGDYLRRATCHAEIQRMPGVGQATLFGTERAMRIWIDPASWSDSALTADDVNNAISAQNAQVASGTHRRPCRASPTSTSRRSVLVKGQLPRPTNSVTSCCARTPTARRCVCATWRASNSAARAIVHHARLNGKPSTGIGVQLSPTATRSRPSTPCVRTMEQLSNIFRRA